MKNRVITIAMALVALFGVSLTITAAQSSVIKLLGNEVAEINCDGTRLIMERISKTQVKAICRPGNGAPTPTNTPSADPTPVPNELAVVNFIWVNADTNQDIGPLTDGSTINLRLMPTRNLKIRAETQPSTVGSVVFAVNGHNNFGTDNTPPYTLGGDAPTSATLSGQYTLTAVPYAGSNGSGTQGTALTVTFTVVDEDSQPPSDNPPPSNVPLCEEHNPNAWHPLYDAAKNCHYDHEHKHNPNEVNDIFGPPGAWFGGGEMSYPWQTFVGANSNYPQWDGNSDNLESVAKHRVYGWIVRRDIPSHDRNVWIKSFRLQYHGSGAPGETLTRHHSFSLEAQVCNNQNNCGIIRTGGWVDFGNLEVNGTPVSLPGQDDAVADNGRRRIHYFYPDIQEAQQPYYKTEFFWYGRNAPSPGDASAGKFGPLQPLSIALASADVFSNVDPNNPQALNFFCPDFKCGKNNSTIQAHVVHFGIPGQYDSDGNGLADYVGYTDRYGKFTEGCTEISLDCIPVIIENVPIGDYIEHRDDRDLGLSAAGMQDFDTSPPGEWWITYPN